MQRWISFYWYLSFLGTQKLRSSEAFVTLNPESDDWWCGHLPVYTTSLISSQRGQGAGKCPKHLTSLAQNLLCVVRTPQEQSACYMIPRYCDFMVWDSLCVYFHHTTPHCHSKLGRALISRIWNFFAVSVCDYETKVYGIEGYLFVL